MFAATMATRPKKTLSAAEVNFQSADANQQHIVRRGIACGVRACPYLISANNRR
ncbi:hypothetical protein THAOC_23468, partial [Thalassiosira oceanica]